MPTVEPIAKESRRERRLRRQREQGQEASAPAPDAQSKSNNINKHGPTKPPKTGPHSHSTSKPSSKNSSAKRRSKSTSRYASPSSSSGSPSTLLLSSTADFKGLESTSEIEEGEMDQPKAGPSRPRRSMTPPAANKNNSQASAKHGFDSQIDFIPFDTEDTSAPLTRNGKDMSSSKGKSGSDVRADERRGDMSGKGKARDVDPPTREWDRGKPPLSDDRDRDRDRHARRRDRDTDRHADGRGRKRDHDRIDENGDTRRDETRRTAHYTESLKAPWTKDVDWDACNNVAEMMHREVEAFVKWASPTHEEDEMRALIVSQITKAVTSAYHDAQVHPFGSFATKLYLPLGDIDLVILSPSLQQGYKDYVLRDLAHVIKRARIADQVTIISRARVPIIKFTSIHGSFHVDISIGQVGGLKSVEIVNNFLNTMSLHSSGMALRALVLIAKAFLSQRNMNEVFTGGLGSYSIVCLAISFLQMHPKIRRGEIDPDKNLGVLVVEFFELYGCYFYYEEVGISVREGGSYYSKMRRGWLDYYNKGLLSIEDPVDPTNDISKGSFSFQKVKTTMAGAFGILTTKLYDRAALIRTRREGSRLSLLDLLHPEDLSILSSILKITKETINHRRLVEEEYNSRALHDLLGVKPRPVVVDAVVEEPKPSKTKPSTAKPASGRRTKESQSVASAWGDDDDEIVILGASSGQSPSKAEAIVDDEESDGGRYGIGQPPHKRRKTGMDRDNHTVYVVDDEEEDSLAEEEAHYISDSSSAQEVVSKKPVSKGDKDRNRSFWLSKAVETNLGDYSE
ncbi:hypothetical protein PC9H_000633 [Pleurotus ostreatus]|uniref:polynucleotide adenylyltransferase n=1 Tax=Pleurotus ostreatus TaxID=5322 RepID=A0A8H7A3W5_PLEOS|nr:uncharacterized protein PC9H_000633 [Pleurotus ostreatus]KAF7440289.1 hypothetical protein PC9H_000633 [Pleurotus ostreatus]KAJ8700412.1 hypothetical protein PTI98_003436 [Pleurotus ostreatus]